MEEFYNYDDRLEEYDERSIQSLESAVSGCLWLCLAVGVVMIVCGAIAIFGV